MHHRVAIGPLGQGPQMQREFARAVAATLAKSDALIMERHGTVAVGKDLAQAYGLTERLEHACQVLWSAYSISTPRPLAASEQRALLRMYEASRR